MDISIRVSNVSKCYRLGAGHLSLRDAINSLPTRLLRRTKQQASHGSEIWALGEVSFEVRRGETLGVIGPNGAGKTTLLRLLSRVTRPTSGHIELHGRVSSLIELGAGFHPDLTGKENVYLNGVILGLKRRQIDALYKQIVEFAELEQFMDTPVKRYSSGMYCRLGFAVAAHVEPEILLIDEVLAVGDTAFQYKCLDRMRRLVSEGRAVVFVSHNLDAVQHICDRVLWLDQGQVALLGQPEDVLRAYLDSIDQQKMSGTTSIPSHGPLHIERVVFARQDGTEATQFETGDSLVVNLHYMASSPIPKPHFTLGISDGRTGMLFLATMLIDGQSPAELHGKGIIRCEFRSLPLMPKVYQLWGEVRDKSLYAQIVPWQILGTFRVIESTTSNWAISQAHADAVSVRHLREDAPIYVPYRWIFD